MDVGVLNLPDGSQGASKTLRVTRGKGPALRRQREFMAEEKKDTVYWEKRKKNNEAAKRSRERRRLNDQAMEGRVAALLQDNAALRAELRALKLHLGLLPPSRDPQTSSLPTPQWKFSRTVVDPFYSLPGPYSCLLRSYSLQAAVPGCKGCLLAPRGAGPATLPRVSQDPESRTLQRIGGTLQAAVPTALFGCHILEGHMGPRSEWKPYWRLWSPVSTGKQASGPSEVMLNSSAGLQGLSLGFACPVSGHCHQAVDRPALPHKLRLKTHSSGPVCGGWGGSQGSL
ncbi:NFIL3 like protein [Thomomys bottae]